MHDCIIIFDAGSQYTQLIARKIRELNVYCEIVPYDKNILPNNNIKGIILSGSPYSVNESNSPKFNIEKFINIVPILGICYGAQFIAKKFGGVVKSSNSREYGRSNLHITKKTPIFENIPENNAVWMSHSDTILTLPQNFYKIASTDTIEIAAYSNKNNDIIGLQFHPEVYHTQNGHKILKNFVIKICKCKRTWTPKNYIEEKVNEIKNIVKNEKVILAISGGVDSSVAALLLKKAINDNLVCVFVNTGFLRKNEFNNVIDTYKQLNLNLIPVDASDIFYRNIKGISEPEEKRKIIGKTFIEVFENIAKSIKDIKWLAQGTIYPDVIESISVHGPSARIKSHHNVGGLPEKLNLKIIEPLKFLFKDEVRKLAKELNLPEEIYKRHPFPGPGLAIRIIGAITPEKIKILQEADHIYIESLKKWGLYDKIWQAGAILLPIKSVGVMGDERTYEYVLSLRAVTSTDGMTADWARLPYDFLSYVSTKIINEVKGINRVVFDISSKPPATIEWE
ncbi:MAG: glutamine-hydrolyzing GMP synthase [Bacteroidales bacterium]|nr:glutamine-hydrolyzing GMP synthase [Bacteroidales bacterium]